MRTAVVGVALLLGAVGMAVASPPIVIEFQDTGYLVGDRHVETLAELETELSTVKPQEARLEGLKPDTPYERVLSVVSILQKLNVHMGLVGTAAPE